MAQQGPHRRPVGQRLRRHLPGFLHFLAFSTANPDAFKAEGLSSLQMVSNEEISAIFDGTAWPTEEAIINALVAAETMTGAGNRRGERLPHDRLRAAVEKFNRVAP